MRMLVRTVRTASENVDCESLKKASSEMKPPFFANFLMRCSTPRTGMPSRFSTSVVELIVFERRSRRSASMAARISVTTGSDRDDLRLLRRVRPGRNGGGIDNPRDGGLQVACRARLLQPIHEHLVEVAVLLHVALEDPKLELLAVHVSGCPPCSARAHARPRPRWRWRPRIPSTSPRPRRRSAGACFPGPTSSSARAWIIFGCSGPYRFAASLRRFSASAFLLLHALHERVAQDGGNAVVAGLRTARTDLLHKRIGAFGLRPALASFDEAAA